MNELASPVSVDSDNTLGDVIESYADESVEDKPAGASASGTSGDSFVR